MSDSFLIENARVVLPEAVIDGWVAVSDGRIAEVGEGAPPERGNDFGGDLLIPGLVELHTDHLESHLTPRPKVRWPVSAAVLAYDAQIVASGITTVFDSLRVGGDSDYDVPIDELMTIAEAISSARDRKLLRADHRTHLRCEICAGDVLERAERLTARHRVHLISLMDHTPGARQFRSLETWKTYYGGKAALQASELDRMIGVRRALHEANYARHRCELVKLADARGIVVASHDDTTGDHVAESISDGVAIAEFPTTPEAAAASHAAGIAVLMGAPNVVRGGSHSGNVAAEALAREGILDILSSDYVPSSLLIGAFELSRRIEGYGLPAAINTVTRNPARATGLTDRGEIAAGQRADLVRVRASEELPVIREVYSAGRRIY